MKQDIIIFGAGGFGREVMWMLEDSNHKHPKWNIRGFVDDTETLKNKTINAYPIVGNTKWLMAQTTPLHVLCCIGDSTKRMGVIQELSKNSHLFFPSFVANNVIHSPDLRLGIGSIICSSVVITVNVTIGKYVIVNYSSTLCHDSVIQDFVSIYPSVNISGFVHIGQKTHLGVGTKILPHITVGNNCIIGAGAVVINDIPSDCTAVGVPAKPLMTKLTTQ